jgi:hypothetical protein
MEGNSRVMGMETNSTPLEKLDLPFMLFCGASSLESSQVSPTPCLRISLTRIEPIFSRC